MTNANSASVVLGKPSLRPTVFVCMVAPCMSIVVFRISAEATTATLAYPDMPYLVTK